MVDIERLNRLIDESGVKKTALAKMMGISPTSLQHKRFGRKEFSLEEAGFLKDYFHLGCRDFVHIFFAEHVPKSETETGEQ